MQQGRWPTPRLLAPAKHPAAAPAVTGISLQEIFAGLSELASGALAAVKIGEYVVGMVLSHLENVQHVSVSRF
jgi:hypothetical protein